MNLLKAGINVKEPSIASYGMKQLYINDPDGYILCFQWPATENTYDQWRDWYGQDLMNENTRHDPV